jgi:hypothetical protein
MGILCRDLEEIKAVYHIFERAWHTLHTLELRFPDRRTTFLLNSSP